MRAMTPVLYSGIIKIIVYLLMIMNVTQSYNNPLILPDDLYQVIEQRARFYGRSVNSEIITILTEFFSQENGENLENELILWSNASDEDWLNMETRLTTEEE